ncbi:hypothetical protein [uncultured Desulfovibrio sp.]|uniref:hypothetical protein n=1 Tax=uncultured Desulfovibrio sp. TaxID=167968 RepID=UPI0026344F5F|nr:hypothetical protein [uncultured Desulfovibrio sp.]
MMFVCTTVLLGVQTVQATGNLPADKATVVSKVPGMKLSIDCVLQAPVDEAMLATLGRKVFEENGGNGFQNVFIMWYPPHHKIGNGAWGTTNFENGKPTVRILQLQG